MLKLRSKQLFSDETVKRQGGAGHLSYTPNQPNTRMTAVEQRPGRKLSERKGQSGIGEACRTSVGLEANIVIIIPSFSDPASFELSAPRHAHLCRIAQLSSSSKLSSSKLDSAIPRHPQSSHAHNVRGTCDSSWTIHHSEQAVAQRHHGEHGSKGY